MISKYVQPCPITFGRGALGQLPALLEEAGVCRPLIITDRGVAAAGLLARTERLLAAGGVSYTSYDAMLPDRKSVV